MNAEHLMVALPTTPDTSLPSQAVAWLRRGRAQVQGVLASYGLVLFGPRGWAALALALSTFLQPERGLLGLLGLLSARRVATWFAPATRAHDLDWLGCNGLLTGLILALFFQPSPALAAVVVAAALLATLSAVALRPLADRYLGVPLLSLPFVLAGWLALLAARRFSELQPVVAVATVEPTWLPSVMIPLLRSLGAVFLQPTTAAGALVLLGLASWSRWAAVLAVLGFFSGWAMYTLLGGPRTDLEQHLLGFNAILCAIAMGGVFVVLSPGSLVLAALSAALATLMGSAMLSAFAPLDLPVLAAPFIAVTDALLLAMMHRLGGGPLQLVQGMPGRPEDNLGYVLQHARRYPPAGTALLYLPVLGRWTVTQGPNGQPTHQGLWSHAWDFEIADDGGHRWRNAGTELHDFYAFGAPVVAPADGRVARAVGHLEDNPIGHVDIAHNFGNAVVLAHASGVFSALCHLQQGSLLVREGDVVVRGQVVGRVGNSGRSPVPHLHVQLQSSADVGAPTLPGEFLQFIRSAPEGRRYETHGSPDTGDVVEAVQGDDAVRRALALPPGSSWTWQVQGSGLPERETWRSTLDGLGRRQLQSLDCAAGLYMDDAYATVLDYAGPADRLLALFALGAARVPFLGDGSVSWVDSPSGLPFMSPLARAGVELVLPFTGSGAVQTESRLRVAAEGIVVETLVRAEGSLARRLPERIELVLRPDVGPVVLRAFRGQQRVVLAQLTTDNDSEVTR